MSGFTSASIHLKHLQHQPDENTIVKLHLWELFSCSTQATKRDRERRWLPDLSVCCSSLQVGGFTSDHNKFIITAKPLQ